MRDRKKMKKLFAFSALLTILLVTSMASVPDYPNLHIEESYLGTYDIVDGYLHISVGEKKLKIDLESFREGIVNVSEDDEMPTVSYLAGNETVLVSQIIEGESMFMFGKPSASLLAGDAPLVYVALHYDPDMPEADASRLSGKKRLTVVVKDAGVKVNNRIIVRTDKLMVHRKTFLDSENLSGNEVDVIDDESGFEILGGIFGLMISSVKITLDNLYDRGFFASNKDQKYELIENISEEYVDVLPEDIKTNNKSDNLMNLSAWQAENSSGCEKIGFSFDPGYGYQQVEATRRFTRGNGWALGTAAAIDDHFQASLTDMSNFISYSYENNLTPIVKILGNHKRVTVEDADSVTAFIKKLREMSGGKLEYVQIWDRPNVDYDEADAFSYPQAYADYVIEIRNKLNDPGIKIIAGGLSIGETGYYDGHRKNNSMEYLDVLQKIPEFWDSIDYWASSAYGMEETYDYCQLSSETSAIENEELCLRSIFAYRYEAEKIEKAIGKKVPLILTDVGYNSPSLENERLTSLFRTIKNDKDVKAAIITDISPPDPSNNWIYIDTLDISPFAKVLSDKVCG